MNEPKIPVYAFFNCVRKAEMQFLRDSVGCRAIGITIVRFFYAFFPQTLEFIESV